MDEAKEPEDRIEHIVREAEQGAQFEFKPAAWAAMEQKLDALEPVPFSIWKILFPLVGVAVVLMLLLWPISAQDVMRVEARKAQSTVESNPVKEKSEATEANPAEGESAPTEQAAQVTAEVGEDDSVAEETTTEITASEPPATPSDGAASTARVDARLTQLEANTNVLDQQAAESADFIAGQEPSGLGQGMDRQPGVGVDMLSVRWNPTPIVLPQPILIFEVDSSNFKEGKPKPYFEKSRWAVMAFVSLDMSATGLDGFTDPGTMFGLAAEYYFAPGWSLQSGAALAVKKYAALGSEYENNWPQARNEALISAVANCLVLDIPLNLRKYFYTKKGKTFFASTGVSSYLMLREDYDYDYTEDRPNWDPTGQWRNDNQHYFGILNLSFGYETPIGKNLALGIEPFMKLPMTGLGQGRVRFLSFGTNVAIKLRK